MSIDWDAQLLDPLYDRLGIEATFLSRGGVHAALVVIDKRSGVERASGVTLQGLVPAICVRVSELEAKGVDRDQVRNGRLTIAEQSWNVESAKPVPTPGGKGELLLYLQERNND